MMDKSDTLIIMDWDLHVYLVNLETGAMEDMTEQFYNTVPNAGPIEIDWPALFMSRLVDTCVKLENFQNAILKNSYS